MTESKPREFCKHNIHESHYCGSCNQDAINKLQSEIKAKDELLRECVTLIERFDPDDCFTFDNDSDELRDEVVGVLQKLREGKK